MDSNASNVTRRVLADETATTTVFEVAASSCWDVYQVRRTGMPMPQYKNGQSIS